MPVKGSYWFRRVYGSVKFGVKLALFAGFGGVLVLMALVGLDFIRELRQIQGDD